LAGQTAGFKAHGAWDVLGVQGRQCDVAKECLGINGCQICYNTCVLYRNTAEMRE